MSMIMQEERNEVTFRELQLYLRRAIPDSIEIIRDFIDGYQTSSLKDLLTYAKERYIKEDYYEAFISYLQIYLKFQLPENSLTTIKKNMGRCCERMRLFALAKHYIPNVNIPEKGEEKPSIDEELRKLSDEVLRSVRENIPFSGNIFEEVKSSNSDSLFTKRIFRFIYETFINEISSRLSASDFLGNSQDDIDFISSHPQFLDYGIQSKGIYKTVGGATCGEYCAHTFSLLMEGLIKNEQFHTATLVNANLTIEAKKNDQKGTDIHNLIFIHNEEERGIKGIIRAAFNGSLIYIDPWAPEAYRGPMIWEKRNPPAITIHKEFSPKFLYQLEDYSEPYRVISRVKPLMQGYIALPDVVLKEFNASIRALETTISPLTQLQLKKLDPFYDYFFSSMRKLTESDKEFITSVCLKQFYMFRDFPLSLPEISPQIPKLSNQPFSLMGSKKPVSKVTQKVPKGNRRRRRRNKR